MKCVILDDYQDVARHYADWSALAGVEVVSVRRHLADPGEVVRTLRGAEIVVVMRERTPLNEAVLARLPSLQLVVTSGMRNASIDLAACRARGITVCGTASRSTPPAELTWALVLGLLRGIPQEAASMRASGPWQSTVGRDLAGATFGVIGLGRIGTRVARVAHAFEMDVVAWSPHLTEERAEAAGVRLALSKRDLMAAADVVSLHLQLSWSTRRIIDAVDIAAMRRDAYFVNTARAGLADNDALVAALQQGRLAGAGLDVFDEEPLPVDHPFRTLPNVLALPHLGYVTAANYRTYFTEAVQDIEGWLAGEPLRVITTSAVEELAQRASRNL